VEQTQERQRAVLGILMSAAGHGSATDLFAQTTQLAKNQKVPFETVLEVLYSFLTDLLELSANCAEPALRNATLGKELISLSKRVNPLWVEKAAEGLDQLDARLRRNINKQLGLDAVALSLSAAQSKNNRGRF
jgi:hypothetical protein